MGKRVLRVRNALTGNVREVVLPARPVVRKPRAKEPSTKKVAVKSVKVEVKPEVSEKGASDGSDNG